ncbi:hypothetical protein JOB18_046018 [Solea senegalensis]|uniref:Uncharacterized protein n=1 Tax=Solea senegalensis TaxID=28829 RepID=A0AAV6PXM1_SOLSE|nr:hypothetical protein JOB18_046018 [Solea senegalensis]
MWQLPVTRHQSSPPPPPPPPAMFTSTAHTHTHTHTHIYSRHTNMQGVIFPCSDLRCSWLQTPDPPPPRNTRPQAAAVAAQEERCPLVETVVNKKMKNDKAFFITSAAGASTVARVCRLFQQDAPPAPAPAPPAPAPPAPPAPAAAV